jgi:Zn-dependent protease with chaperone function
MEQRLVYPRERALGALTLVLGLLAWIFLIGMAAAIAGLASFFVLILYVLLAFIGYVFAQSGVIAWIKGTAVKLSAEQHPDLYQRFESCCQKLGMKKQPDVYVLEGNGLLNAFATRFFGRNFVVLLSGVIDALEEEPEGIGFYMGHELGHIRRGHLTGKLWRLPVLWLPLLGAAYARAQEYTCDLHGRACCTDAQAAARALMVLAAGEKRWKTSNLASYARQAEENNGFWGSFHELIGIYPWLAKRVAHVQNPSAPLPGRNPLAYVLALFVPNGGRFGGGFGGMMIGVCMIGVLAAIAVPAYQKYQNHAHRAVFFFAWQSAEPVRKGLAAYYEENEEIPDSLEEAGLPSVLSDGTEIALDRENMTISVPTKAGRLYMIPSPMEDGSLRWSCSVYDSKLESALPEDSR